MKKSLRTRYAILNRDGWVCAYCGTDLNEFTATLDHVIPRAQGGSNNRSNLVAACQPCNTRKADRTPSEARMPVRRYRAGITRALPDVVA